MGKEHDDIEFEALLSEQRHNQQVSILNSIASSINKNTNSEIALAIGKQSKLLSSFMENLSKLPTPVVNVDVHQKDVIASVKYMGDLILKGLGEIDNQLTVLNRPKEWKFTVHRNNGFIESVTAKMEYTKPKYNA